MATQTKITGKPEADASQANALEFELALEFVRVVEEAAIASAITMLAASEHGGLLNAPDCYMEKLVVGPSCKDVVELDAPVRYNLKAIAQALGRKVKDLVVMVLERPRHEKLVEDIRNAGARIK